LDHRRVGVIPEIWIIKRTEAHRGVHQMLLLLVTP
jgi:hypothetical protein